MMKVRVYAVPLSALYQYTANRTSMYSRCVSRSIVHFSNSTEGIQMQYCYSHVGCASLRVFICVWLWLLL